MPNLHMPKLALPSSPLPFPLHLPNCCICTYSHVCTQLKPHNQVREKDENFDNLWLFKLTCVLNNQNQGVFFPLVEKSFFFFMS